MAIIENDVVHLMIMNKKKREIACVYYRCPRNVGLLTTSLPLIWFSLDLFFGQFTTQNKKNYKNKVLMAKLTGNESV